MRVSLAILVVGVVIVLSGFAYDLMFAGIPYPDPTPAQMSDYDRGRRVADGIIVAGLFPTAAGALGVCVTGALALIRRCNAM
jgi:hypothetical protein